VSDVNQLVDRFFEARKMMLSMAKGGGMPGVPGMPGLGGAKRAKGKQPVKKAKARRVSGNPAKRAAEQRAAAQRTPTGAGANPFGVPGGVDDDFDPASLELPADLSKYLK
jgi:signal recognition particle subunit SRP54